MLTQTKGFAKKQKLSKLLPFIAHQHTTFLLPLGNIADNIRKLECRSHEGYDSWGYDLIEAEAFPT